MCDYFIKVSLIPENDLQVQLIRSQKLDKKYQALFQKNGYTFLNILSVLPAIPTQPSPTSQSAFASNQALVCPAPLGPESPRSTPLRPNLSSLANFALYNSA